MVNVNLKMVWTKSVNRNSVVVRTEGDNEGRVRWKSLSHVRLFATPGTTQSMEFSRPEYWSGQPFPSPGELPNPGIKPRSPALQADSLPAGPQGSPRTEYMLAKKNKKQTNSDFPASPMVKTLSFGCRAWVWSLAGELRSHMPCGAAKKNVF